MTREPQPPLGRFVATLWHARGTIPYTREKIAPTGSTVAVFVLGDPIVHTAMGEPFRAERGFLVGPHDRPTVNEPTGETFAAGIVTTPVGCAAIFGVPPASLRGRVVDLLEAWPAATQIRDRLLAGADAQARLRDLDRHLASSVRADAPGLTRCEAAVAMLSEERTVAEVADALGVSHGHLDREMKRVVGLSPRALSRIHRMRRLLSDIDERRGVDWAALAANHGWFDQAHLIRDFKRYTGVTPKQYLAAREPYLGDEDDAPGFVPER